MAKMTQSQFIKALAAKTGVSSKVAKALVTEYAAMSVAETKKNGVSVLPGIGRLLVGAIYARDFIILQGVVLFVAVGFVIVNFIVDMLYAVLDPRIRHGRA